MLISLQKAASMTCFREYICCTPRNRRLLGALLPKKQPGWVELALQLLSWLVEADHLCDPWGKWAVVPESPVVNHSSVALQGDQLPPHTKTMHITHGSTLISDQAPNNRGNPTLSGDWSKHGGVQAMRVGWQRYISMQPVCRMTPSPRQSRNILQVYFGQLANLLNLTNISFWTKNGHIMSSGDLSLAVIPLESIYLCQQPSIKIRGPLEGFL